MRVSRLFGKTHREDPGEAEIPSHRLMLRAGLIYQVSAGVFSYMPLALRSLRKIEQIIREEMDREGGQELRMPALQPQSIWDESGRTEILGDEMFKLRDRRDRPLVMAPTHEEVLTHMVKANVHSYRDLPLILYQIQTKFRDEPRPRGGLLRVREFDMKDAYSFDANEAGLDDSYRAMVQAYNAIYERCGLSTTMVEADSGAIGGKDSHEFIALSESGEDTVLICDGGDYAANVERAAFKKPEQPIDEPEEVEEVHTPDIKTIEGLAEFLDVPTAKTLKAVFYMADGELVFATIRGDLEVNDTKLKNTLKVAELRLASPEEVREAGLVAGSASPVGRSGVKVVADDSVEMGSNFVAGANTDDYHLKNVNHPRDFRTDVVTDIAEAQEGDMCPNGDGRLVAYRGIEVGHIFKLGTRYSEVIGAYFPNSDGAQTPAIMGCYGIGVGRLLAAAIEQSHDENGMVFPAAIAPYHVWITALNFDKPEVAEAAEKLYDELQSAGVEALLDDRDESPGVKFNDADLMGLPVRVVVSPRNLKEGVVEVKKRSEDSAEMVPQADAVAKIKELLG